MFIPERVRQLRKDKGWSQAELAEKAETDARQISRYEKGHVTPSVEVIVKLAIAFDVTIDYFLIKDAPRRPLKMERNELLDRAHDLQQLSADDRVTLLKVLDAFVAKSKVKSLAENLP